MTTLYVGRLSEEVTEMDLRSLLASYDVQSVEIMADDTTKRPRGFALIGIDGDASLAVEHENGKELHGRTIVVKVMA